MAESVLGESAEVLPSEEPWLGTLDLILLTALAGVSVYYFFLKSESKNDDDTTLKSFTIA